MGEHAGRRGVVIGGASGIGLATAALLLRRGAEVQVLDLQPMSRQTAEPDMRWLRCDVSDSDSVRTAIEHASGDRPLDFVAYSAGIQRYGSVTETSVAAWDRVQAVNVRGLFLAAHYALPHMRAGGSLVAVSSIQSQATQQKVAAYAASKGAMEALIRSIAVDFAAAGIRANCVLPGTTDTPMVRASAEAFRGDGTALQTMDQWGRVHPLGRVAAAEEVAEVIAFLLGTRASFVTGAS